MEVYVLERAEMKTIAIKVGDGGAEVRKGWHLLQKKLEGRSWNNRNIGYVFIPEWQWASGVKELYVGVELDTDMVPRGAEKFVVPTKLYATIKVHGDKKHMEESYAFLNEWIKANGYEKDISKGSYSVEANPLKPVNPFDIPADEVKEYEYTIYAPVKKIG